jgi:hypothetical protein
MPIELRINHLDRMVTGIAYGDLTGDQLSHTATELSTATLFHYKKLIDVSAAFTHVTFDEVATIVPRFLDRPQVIHSGPIAVVADPKRKDMAQLFVELVGNNRLIKIFYSIHEARKWLFALV